MEAQEQGRLKRVRGVILTPKAFELLEQGILKWWISEGFEGRPSRTNIAGKLDLSVQTVNRIFSRQVRVDRRSVGILFDGVKVPWNSTFFTDTPNRPVPRPDDLWSILEASLRNEIPPLLVQSNDLLRILTQQGRLVKGKEWLKEQLEKNIHISPMAAPYAWKTLAHLCVAAQDYSLAETALLAARKGFEKADNPAGLATCHSKDAYLAWQTGNYSRALNSQRAALVLWRELSDQANVAKTLRSLGDVYLQLASLADARTCFEEALNLHRILDDTHYVALDLASLACLASREGDYTTAQDTMRGTIQMAREHLQHELAAYLSYDLAAIALEHKDVEAAHRSISDCLNYFCEVGNVTYIEGFYHLVIALEGLRSLLDGKELPLRRARRIAQLCGAKQALREELMLAPIIEVGCPNMLAAKSEALKTLGENAYSQAEEKGRAMNYREAVQFALTFHQ